jgi:hypothetical protein
MGKYGGYHADVGSNVVCCSDKERDVRYDVLRDNAYVSRASLDTVEVSRSYHSYGEAGKGKVSHPTLYWREDDPHLRRAFR